MDCCLSYVKPTFPPPPSAALRRPITFGPRIGPLVVAAGASRAVKCEFGGLTAPLKPRTQAGRFLSGLLLDGRDGLEAAARKELERLAAERDESSARSRLSLGSDEACLHRRIAELKNQECQDSVQEVMYTLILDRFSEMGVHLTPKLSKCVYNGRLEIWPSKEWELESIHSFDVLHLVREHLTALIGCRIGSNVSDSWATTEIQRLRLCRLYASSILYGYFLKSASLRHKLEIRFNYWKNKHIPISEMHFAGDHHAGPPRISSVDRRVSPSYNIMGSVSLRVYVMGFDQEMIQMCAKPKSREAADLIERHSCALFGDNKDEDIIITSFASLKRLLLEGVAFGSFLWDSEECVNAVYMLEED